jgi:hypothetical protein
MDAWVSRLNTALHRVCTQPGSLGIQKLVGAGLLVLLLAASSTARKHNNAADTFSIDIDASYNTVVNVVREVANDGVIRGTFEYRDTQDLPGAESARSSRFFRPWNGPGEVFFKVRSKALSPAHFVASNDMGTVVVRYVVRELGASSTRLFIDAVFVEDSGHRNHPSDGSVETSEFGYIQQRLKAPLEVQPQTAQQQDAPRPEGQSRTDELQHALSEEAAKLSAAQANLQALETRAQELRVTTTALVTTDHTELKISPYVQSHTIKTLAKGEEVTILAKSPYWDRVRDAAGQEGWIYHLLLEPPLP